MTKAAVDTDARLLAPLRGAMYDFDLGQIEQQCTTLLDKTQFHLCHPFGSFQGGQLFFDKVINKLAQAFADVERRETIVVSGKTPEGADWVGCCGSYLGTFTSAWLDIPPTGHLTHMRFHEFFRIENGCVVEVQAIWDIPEVMMQAGAWPMAPSLGRELHVPGPATQDGLGPHDPANSEQACQHVLDMLTAMQQHPKEPPKAMQMDRFWHSKMNWYGPAGIGTARGIDGFRHWHQIPFLNAMPDRGQYPDEVDAHFFAQGNYVAVTGWPNMTQTHANTGWLGLGPSGKKITLRSLDFWRLEVGKIRENWVLVDLLDVYRQLGIDVFARLGEFNKARNLGPIQIPDGIALNGGRV